MDQPATPGRPAVGKIRNEQEHADLLNYHIAVLRQVEAKVETAKGPVADAKADLSDAHEELTKAFNQAKADLGRGYSRDYLQGLMVDGRKKATQLIDHEKQRARDKAALHQPVYGLQPELFGEGMTTYHRDEFQWGAEGYLRGLRGDIREIQDGDPPEFHQVIIAGFRKGQEETQAAFLRAQELKAREGQPDAGAETKDLNAGEGDTETSLDEAAAKLKKSGFMERSEGGEDDAQITTADVVEAVTDVIAEGLSATIGGGQGADSFEAPPAELEKQTTRRVIKDAKAGATSGAAKAAAVH